MAAGRRRESAADAGNTAPLPNSAAPHHQAGVRQAQSLGRGVPAADTAGMQVPVMRSEALDFLSDSRRHSFCGPLVYAV
jgi:hypothetical protein